MHRFRLLDTGRLPAAENMALDRILLEETAADLSLPTVRFLQFSPAAALVGYHQDVSLEIRADYCTEHGIDVNRRHTGGGAILFQESALGWEIFGIPGAGPFRGSFEEILRTICDAAASGISRLGTEARFRPRNDIEIKGRKISGTGGTSVSGAFLFQGTLLIQNEVELFLRALRVPVEKLKKREIDSLMDRICFLSDVMRPLPSLAEIKAALAFEFARTLEIELEPAGLTTREQERLVQEAEFFASPQWIVGRLGAATKRLGAVANNRVHLPRSACKPMAGRVGSTPPEKGSLPTPEPAEPKISSREKKKFNLISTRVSPGRLSGKEGYVHEPDLPRLGSSASAGECPHPSLNGSGKGEGDGTDPEASKCGRGASRRGLEGEVLRSITQTEAGTMRVHLWLGSGGLRVRQALISGDFFAIPDRLVHDLEAWLVGKRADAAEIRVSAEGFLRDYRGEILGIAPADVARAVAAAAERLVLVRDGFAGDEANELFLINVRPEELKGRRPRRLLLPYCAKDLFCEYRYVPGCEECGKCEIGDCFELARQHGVIPITVQSFEHLIEVLRTHCTNGDGLYVGSCCEAFYAKHQQEMEAVPAQGILVNLDSTTCYDLGKGSAAYQGRFDNKTSMNMVLLEKILTRLNGH
ncbi:MAG: DUF116 domain-containing protein [Thermodesulfobacteriota bacterium]